MLNVAVCNEENEQLPRILNQEKAVKRILGSCSFSCCKLLHLAYLLPYVIKLREVFLNSSTLSALTVIPREYLPFPCHSLLMIKRKKKGKGFHTTLFITLHASLSY